MKRIWAHFLVFFCAVLFSPFVGYAQEESNPEELKQIVEAIQKIVLQKKAEHINTPSIIAIGGIPGVGKSSMANILQLELAKQNVTSVIIRIDHYGLSQKQRKQFSNKLDPRRIQWNKIHETLIDIKEGKEKITKPTINQLTKIMGEETLTLNDTDCVLFEGCYSLNNFFPMNYRQYADLAIYLETSLENIYDWKWERELKKPLPRKEEAFLYHMKAIVEDFAFHVYPSRKNADYIIQIDSSHHYSIFTSTDIKAKPTSDFTAIRLESILY